MSKRPILLFVVLLCLPGAACTTSNHVPPDGAGATDQGGGADRGGDLAISPDSSPSKDSQPTGYIDIFVKGDLAKPAFKDGLSGQTPQDYVIAISRYHILKSAADPSPVLCFDHGKNPSLAIIANDTKVGYCATSSIKSGLYTHGRTKIDWATYKVKGVYHYLGQKLAGTFTFFRAYSDTVFDGKAYKAGHGTITFSGVTTVSIPVVYGPPPSVPGVAMKTQGGVFTMTFPFGKPLPIKQDNTKMHWARFHWKIGDAFRWADTKLAGYQPGVWDVSPIVTSTEAVKLFGVSGFHVTSSVD